MANHKIEEDNAEQLTNSFISMLQERRGTQGRSLIDSL